METAIQLYTLRDLDEPVADLVSRVGETAFDGVEFAGVDDPTAIVDALDATGLRAPSAHVGIDDLERAFEETVETYRSLGCEMLVVPYLDASHFADEEAVAATANRLERIAERLAEHDLGFAYHNHDHEFVDVGDRTAFDVLCERTDRLDLQIDAGWVDAAGYDPTELLERLDGRVRLLHLKDTDGTRSVELGDGTLDVAACVEAARGTAVEWLVYEHDEPTDPVESLEHGATTLAGFVED